MKFLNLVEDTYGNFGVRLYPRFVLDGPGFPDALHQNIITNGGIWNIKTNSFTAKPGYFISPYRQITSATGLAYFNQGFTQAKYIPFNPSDYGYGTSSFYPDSLIGASFYNEGFKYVIHAQNDAGGGPYSSILIKYDNIDFNCFKSGIFSANYNYDLFSANAYSKLSLGFSAYGGQQYFPTMGIYGLDVELDYNLIQAFNVQMYKDIGNSFYPYVWGGAGFGPQYVYPGVMGYATGLFNKIVCLPSGLDTQAPGNSVYGFNEGLYGGNTWPILQSNSLVSCYSIDGSFLRLCPFVSAGDSGYNPGGLGTYNNFYSMFVDRQGILWGIMIFSDGKYHVVSSGDNNSIFGLFAPELNQSRNVLGNFMHAPHNIFYRSN